MRWTALFVALLLGCSGVGPMAEEACLGIPAGTPLQSLPVQGSAGPYSSVSHGMGPTTGETLTLRCCQECSWGQRSCACGVDCADPARRAVSNAIGSPYSGVGECGESGFLHPPTATASCNVWSRDGQVVGAWFVCAEPGC